ncbi:hypothetical protein GF337_05995 [candidate division KSB1 bacterium]|nr:hypothetical protein [candidate division KSB1 bacterium]
MIDTDLNRVFKPLFRGLPGVIGVVLFNNDGKPVYVNGRIDISVYEFGAKAAVCYAAAEHAGNLLDRELYAILTEFNNLKIFQIKISQEYFLSVILKINDAYLGEIRRKLGRAVKDICRYYKV